MRKRLPLVLVTVVLFGCSKKPTGPSPEATRKAQEALVPFKKRLKETLLGAMSQGPTSAVEACADQAAKIATEASHPGAKLGRSTNQPRNPANEVRGWQAEALAQFAATPQLEGATYARVLPSGVTAYAEPITIQPVCLTCHGKNVDATLLGVIQKRYPQDRATGYENGQLRGIFWAEMSP